MSPSKVYETREVLAGAYRGADISRRALLTHVIELGATSSLCGRVSEDHLCDVRVDALPTCSTCLKRLAKAMDLGPPRRVTGMDEHDAECERQRRLIEAGYLRAYNGVTWGWRQGRLSNGRLVWHWSSQFNYGPSAHDHFEDHELAWADRERWR